MSEARQAVARSGAGPGRGSACLPGTRKGPSPGSPERSEGAPVSLSAGERAPAEAGDAVPGAKRRGQVVVEIILVLPVFLMVIFMIMELGHLAFQTIVLHHATYEVARIGGLMAAPKEGEYKPNLPRAREMMRGALKRMLKNATLRDPAVDATLIDRQTQQQNYDLVVTVDYPVPLIFPLTNVALENKGPIKKKFGGANVRWVQAQVRMPIQQPAFK